MKKVITALALILASTGALANTADNSKSAFQCVDKSSLQISSECVQDLMSNNAKMKSIEKLIVKKEWKPGGADFATIKYYPELRLMRVIAQKPQADALEIAKAL